tara:strand:- start:135 stop:395 length:261 start_codon:yes stop_codon:yes gene_type:complete
MVTTNLGTAIIFVLLMFTADNDINDYKQADEFMYTDSLSTCLKLRREATRNTRDNLIFKCIKAEVELEKHNATHSLHIKKINKEIK